MKMPPKTEPWPHEGIDLHDLHNHIYANRAKPAHFAPVPTESGRRSPSHAPVYNRRHNGSGSLPGKEVRVVTEQVVVCPNCSHEIKLTEAISAPIVERLRRQFEAEARKKGEELARREQALTDKTAEIEKAKETIDAQVAERLKAERQRVAKEEAEKASEALAAEMTDLRQQLDDKASKLDEAQKERA